MRLRQYVLAPPLDLVRQVGTILLRERRRAELNEMGDRIQLDRMAFGPQAGRLERNRPATCEHVEYPGAWRATVYDILDLDRPSRFPGQPLGVRFQDVLPRLCEQMRGPWILTEVADKLGRFRTCGRGLPLGAPADRNERSIDRGATGRQRPPGAPDVQGREMSLRPRLTGRRLADLLDGQVVLDEPGIGLPVRHARPPAQDYRCPRLE